MLRRLVLALLLAVAPAAAMAQVNSQGPSVVAYVRDILNGNITINGNLNITGDYSKGGIIIPETVSSPLVLSGAGLLSCPTCVLISGTAHGDSIYAILSTDRYVYTNAAFTAPRTWTLPAANSLAAGTTIWIQDAQGTVTSTNTLTISRAGADTIDIANTTLVITGAGGGITFTTDGVSNWGTPIQTVTTGGTGQKTLTNHGLLVGAGANPVTQLAVGATSAILTGSSGADPAFTATGAGVLTALGVNVGTAGAPVINGGDMGTPSAGVGTNITSLNATNLSAGTVAAARGGAGAITGALKANGAGVVSQAACADLSNGTTNCSAAVGQLPGTTTNDNASTGNVGEFVSSDIVVGSAVSLSNNVSANITSISLTAGDWDISLLCGFTGGGTTTVTNIVCSASTTTGTLDATDGRLCNEIYNAFTVFANGNPAYQCGPARFSISGTTTVFFVSRGTFAVSTLSGFGLIRARRVR